MPFVRVHAPASISNIGPGFDILGMALEHPGDEVTVRTARGRGIVSVTVIGDPRIPTDPERNAAGLAVQSVLDRMGARRVAHGLGDESSAGATGGGGAGLGVAGTGLAGNSVAGSGVERTGVAIEVRKGIPLASGLGGSAASAVAGAVAANALLGAGLDRTALLECAMIGERKGSGADHADNAAPSLAGGLMLVLPGRPPQTVALPAPRDLAVAVAHPHLEVETKRARAILGDAIPLAAGVTQWGNAAGLVAGLFNRDWQMIARCTVDAVAEPVRAALVPGFEAVRDAALAAGAAAAGLSGSGPSVFALCRGRERAGRAASAMSAAFRDVAGVDSDCFVSGADAAGARIVEASGAPVKERRAVAAPERL